MRNDKNVLFTLIVAVLFGLVWFGMYPKVAARAAQEGVAELPPQLPASFWGYVQGGHSGQSINVLVGGRVAAVSSLFSWENKAVYSLDVPMDGIADGTSATFKIAGAEVGKSKLNSGTNSRLDLEYKPKREAEAEPNPYLPPEPESCDWVWYLLGLCE